MPVSKRLFKTKSSDGIHDLSGVVFSPEGVGAGKTAIKGFFHIVHGMTEYIGRYEKIMTDIAENGYVCFGYDNLGHGRTANDDSELGFVAEKGGWDLWAKDVKVFSDAVISDFGESGKDIPYFLMGHSMGSFIVRLAAQKYVVPNGLIVMGTGGANPASNAGLALIGIIKMFYGPKHVSQLVNKLAFGNYNKHFEDDGVPEPWLTSDTEIRKRCSSDKYCTFKFSVSAMGDLIRVMKYSNSSSWYKNISKDIPILLVSGEEDPVGNYSKGVTEVYEKLKKQNANVKCILYKKGRHEILNDFTYPRVKEDIAEFMNSNG